MAIPPPVRSVLTRWGEGLKTLDLTSTCCLGPDSYEWSAVRYLQDTRDCEAFAAFLLPFVQDALGPGFRIRRTRLVGGMSFQIVFGTDMQTLKLFSRIDPERLEINAHAFLTGGPYISAAPPAT
jgi:hypothetical protein